MKQLILSILIAAVTLPFTALAQDTTWFNSAWKPCTAGQAAYYRTKVKTDGVWQIADHYRSGKLQMTGGYADDSFHVSQGEWTWYDGTGIILHRCYYVQGKLEGPDTLYYPDGRKRVTGKNKAGHKEGEWLGYYPSGKLSGKAKYEKDKQVSGTYFNEDGSSNKTVNVFMRNAEYPGGVPQFLRFLNKTLRYPDSAVVHEIQGTVITQFIVTKEGKDIRAASHPVCQ